MFSLPSSGKYSILFSFSFKYAYEKNAPKDVLKSYSILSLIGRCLSEEFIRAFTQITHDASGKRHIGMQFFRRSICAFRKFSPEDLRDRFHPPLPQDRTRLEIRPEDTAQCLTGVKSDQRINPYVLPMAPCFSFANIPEKIKRSIKEITDQMAMRSNPCIKSAGQ